MPGDSPFARVKKETPGQKRRAADIIKELGYTEEAEELEAASKERAQAPFAHKSALKETRKTYNLPINCTWCKFRELHHEQVGKKKPIETEVCAQGMLDPIPAPGEGIRRCHKFEPIDLDPQNYEDWFAKYAAGGNQNAE